MDAHIGKYKVHMEEYQLIITHPAGISFDLTLNEAMDLWQFINIHRTAITTMLQETEPRLEAIKTEELTATREHTTS